MNTWKKMLVPAMSMSLACSMLLSGCAGKADGGSDTGDTSGKLSGSITVAGWNDAADALSAEAKAFMSENAGTTVTVQKETATTPSCMRNLRPIPVFPMWCSCRIVT